LLFEFRYRYNIFVIFYLIVLADKIDNIFHHYILNQNKGLNNPFNQELVKLFKSFISRAFARLPIYIVLE